MTNRLKALKIDYVSMVPRPANQESTFVLAKAAPDDDNDDDTTETATGTKKKTPAMKQEPTTVPAPVTPAVEATAITKADLDAAIAAAVERVNKAHEDQLATASTAIAKLSTDLEAASTRAVAAEVIAKAEQEARETAVAIAKAETELKSLPGTTPKDTGTLLLKISKLIPVEDFVKLEALLKASAVAMSKSALFLEVGSSRVATGEESSALGQIQLVAKSLVEKDPTMTPAQSVSKAMTLRPDLVKQARIDSGDAPANS